MTNKAHDFSDHLAMGNAILRRLGKSFPSALKPQVKGFQETHAKFETAAAEADAVQNDRDGALHAIARADETLDKSVLMLAESLVLAGLGARKNPFAKLSRHTPEQIVELPYYNEVKEVRALLVKLSKAKALKAAPRTAQQALAASVASCTRDAREVDAALRKLVRPQTQLAKVIAARDGLLLEWMKALSLLKKHAAAAWDAEDAAYSTLFASPDATQPSRPGTKQAAQGIANA